MNVNFSTYVPDANQGQGGGAGEYAITAFSIPDGGCAIVRFPYKSVDEFDLRTTHSIKVGNYYKRVNCLGSVAECPLCASNSRVNTRFYAHLLQYTQRPDGTVLTESKIWDRTYDFATTLAEYIKLYGDLSKLVFKVTRRGQRLDTEYNTVLLPSEMYPTSVYPDNFKDFDNFKLTGFFCLSKTASELQTFLNTGSFPPYGGAAAPQAQPVAATPAAPTAPAPANDFARAPRANQPAVNIPGIDPAFNPQPMEEVLQAQVAPAPNVASPVVEPQVAPVSVPYSAAPQPAPYSAPAAPVAPQSQPATAAEAPRPRRYNY